MSFQSSVAVPGKQTPFIVLSFILVLFLGGCAAGIVEFQHYDRSFDAQMVEANKVLDRLAVAERKIALPRERRRPNEINFDPSKAAYYINVGDPPSTGAIRASLKSLQSYNKALTGLANGEAANALTARVGAVTSNLLATAGAFSVATGGSEAFVPAGSAIVSRVLPIFEQVKSVSDRAAFRRLLVEAYPDMRELLVTMRTGTKDIFRTIKRSYETRRSIDGGSRIPAADLPRLRDDRKLLAGWVILIDQSLAAMEAAVQAALSGASQTDIAILVESSIELRVLAEKVKLAQSSD